MIKKFFLTLIIMIFSFFLSGKAEAVFTIELNYYSIDFGNMDSGSSGSYKDDIPPQGVEVTCTTDQGNAWFLKIRNDEPLTHTSNPAATIPNTDFKWYGVNTTGAGTLITTREDFTVEKTVYSGTAAEGSNGIAITMKFELTVPPLMQSGTYDTNIVFTFTE